LALPQTLIKKRSASFAVQICVLLEILEEVSNAEKNSWGAKRL